MSDEFTNEQLEEFKEAFRVYDKDGDGAVTAKQLNQIMKDLGKNLTKVELQQLIRDVVVDDGDTISFPDFLTIVTRTMNDNSYANELIEAFRVFDKDGSGYVSMKELKQIIGTLSEGLNSEEVDEVIREIPVDSHGRVNYKEFVNTLTSN